MKAAMQRFLVMTLLVMVGTAMVKVNAQITAVDYKIVHNAGSGEFDVYLRVLEGKTTTTRHRIQFNSQISIVVPTGSGLEIVKNHMPLQDNQELKGTLPMEWDMVKPLIAPPAMPTKDFYAIRPTLIPTALYNHLMAGDEVKLFSFKCNTTQPLEVRLYKNGEDPDSGTGMYGRDFFNSFCIGGIADIYKRSSM